MSPRGAATVPDRFADLAFRTLPLLGMLACGGGGLAFGAGWSGRLAAWPWLLSSWPCLGRQQPATDSDRP